MKRHKIKKNLCESILMEKNFNFALYILPFKEKSIIFNNVDKKYTKTFLSTVLSSKINRSLYLHPLLLISVPTFLDFLNFCQWLKLKNLTNALFIYSIQIKNLIFNRLDLVLSITKEINIFINLFTLLLNKHLVILLLNNNISKFI